MAALGLLVSVLPMAAFAHKVSSVSLISYFDTKEGTYLLDAAMEVIPSEEQALNDQISPKDAAREFAEGYLFVMFDEVEQSPKVDINIITASDEDTPDSLQQQEVVVKMSGDIPVGAKNFMMYLDPTSPMAVVMVVVKDKQPSRRMQVILAGEYSRQVNVEPLVKGDPFENPSGNLPKPEEQKASSTDEGEIDTSDRGEGDSIAGAFFAGWNGILGGTLLLILMPIGLFLLTTSVRPLIYQVAAVLIGQSLAVSLAAWGIAIAGLPIVQILGAILAVICFEAIFHQRLGWWRLPLLLFAGVLSGSILAGTGEFLRLFSDPTNMGVDDALAYVTGAELAILVTVLIAALVFLMLSRFDWYRKSVVQPLAVLIGGYGIFEAIGKLF